MKVLVDTNTAEDRLAALLQAGRERLDVGDVRVETDDEAIVFERKTWSDLASSIVDGRYSDQKRRALHAPDAKPTTYCYVIEGPLPAWQGSFGRMPCKAVWCALIKTSLRDRMPVFHTLSTGETADLVRYVAQQLGEGGFVPSTSASAAPLAKRKRENMENPALAYRAMLTLIPGMSEAKAEVLAASFPSFSHLLSAAEADIAELRCAGRRFGPKLAKRVVYGLHAQAGETGGAPGGENGGAPGGENGRVPGGGLEGEGGGVGEGGGGESEEHSLKTKASA